MGDDRLASDAAPGGASDEITVEPAPSDSGEVAAGITDAADADEAIVEPPRLPDAILALDIGGREFEVGLMTVRGKLIDRGRAPIEPDVGPQSHFSSIANLLNDLVRRANTQHQVEPRAIGIGSTGWISPNCEAVSPLAVTSWREFPLRDHLMDLTGLPVYGEIDARALALAEGWLGAAQGLNSFCAMTVSTGIEGGLVIDGELRGGATGHAGQVGHLIVEPGGRRCRCGARGCLDAEASGAAIESITGRSPTEPTYDIMRRTGKLVGRAAAMLCTSLDLDLVVVGGGVALGFAATFFNAAQREIDDNARLGLGAAARITPAKLGDQGALIGAGAVGLRGLLRNRAAAAS